MSLPPDKPLSHDIRREMVRDDIARFLRIQRAGRLRQLARRLPFAARLVMGLAGLVLLGTLLFYIPGMTTRPLKFTEAAFTAVSALTVTGLTIITPAQDLTPLGQALLAVLMQIGGIGFLILIVIIFRLLGRRISLLDRINLRNSLGAVTPGSVIQLVWRVLAGVFAFEILGAFLLFLHWRKLLGNDWDALGYAIFHAISAFCNAGFDLFNGSRRFPAGFPTDGLSLGILTGLIIIGGLGVPVMADLLALWKDRRLLLNTKITLVMVISLLLIGCLGIFLSEMTSGVRSPDEPWYNRLGLSFYMSAAARTGGFNLNPGFSGLTPASQFLIISLMFIGAAPASMGGGITTGTAAVLGITVISFIRNRPTPEIAGRSISQETVRRASAVVIISLLIVVIATWLLLITHPGIPLINALFEVASAFATCGLSLAFTTQLNGFGLIVIMLVMFWGRLGAITVVLALARRPATTLVRYPEEHILIG